MGKKVIQYTSKKELIKEWPSITEAAQETGIDRSKIWRCLNHRQDLAGGYMWRYNIRINSIPGKNG